MGVRFFVQDHQGELDAVETATEDDFMYFRDSVHLALESGTLGSRFPMLFKAFFSDWQIADVVGSADVPGLEDELREIHTAFRNLPPEPPDGHWRARLRHAGRTPETLAEVYVDKDGVPLLKRLIALAQTARQNRLPIRWGESSTALAHSMSSVPESGADSGSRRGNGEVIRNAPAAAPSQTRDWIARILGSTFRRLRDLCPWRRDRLDRRLLDAAGAGNLLFARAALVIGASPDASATMRDDQGCSSTTPALYTASTRRDAGMVKLLLSRGANPNARFERRGIIDFETRTCLIAALPNADIALMLLQAGADPNLPSTWGEDRTTETSPLAHAKGNPALEGLLRSYGAR